MKGLRESEAARVERFKEGKLIEDQVVKDMEGKSKEYKAILYSLLYAEGMNLQDARQIKIHYGLTT